MAVSVHFYAICIALLTLSQIIIIKKKNIYPGYHGNNAWDKPARCLVSLEAKINICTYLQKLLHKTDIIHHKLFFYIVYLFEFLILMYLPYCIFSTMLVFEFVNCSRVCLLFFSHR